MAQYTVKSYDFRGRLVGRAQFDASGDAEADALFRQVAGGRRKELWRGPRLVRSTPEPAEERRRTGW